MPESRHIDFSEKALAERKRSGHSHALTSVRARWTWILFSAVTVFFAALVGWGFFGSIVDSVSGHGILLLRGGVRPVIAQSDGMLTQLNVQVGSPVSSAQTIGQIYNAQTFFNVRKLEMEYRQLVRECEMLTAGSQELTDLLVEIERERAANLAALTKKYDLSLARSKDLAARYEHLTNTRDISLVNYYEALDAMLNTEAQLFSTKLQAMVSSEQARVLTLEQRQNLISLESRRLQKEFEVELARKLFRDAFWITAGFDGSILELLKAEGDFVRQGERIALVASDLSKGLYLAGFISAESGKKVESGMSAYFAPASVKPDEYGYIQGVVREVSRSPVTAESVLAELNNSSLTQTLAGGGAMIRVTVELIPDPGTVSGLKWTSRAGAPVKLSNGALGTLIINTEYRAPASYLIPYARAALFGSG